jgi:hypothetical protein
MMGCVNERKYEDIRESMTLQCGPLVIDVHNAKWLRMLVISAAIVLLSVYAAIFLRYLPTDRGTAGHDYGLFLPNLLTGYFLFLENGIWQIPWFSPSQCGGVPFFPDPQVPYFSIPQFLVFIVSPITAVRITMLSFAMFGFIGFYVLMRNSFESTRSAATLSAGLFMFNGFFAYRMLIGHLTFHSFMLLPFIAAAVLPAYVATRLRFAAAFGRISVAGLCLAYMLQSGNVHGILPALLSISIIIMINAMMFGWRWFPWCALAAAGTLALLLCAGKLVSELSFLSNFPREFYPLPGFPSLGRLLVTILAGLFIRVPYFALGAITNSVARMGQHELENGVSPTPLVLIAIVIVAALVRFVRQRAFSGLSIERILLGGAVIALLAIPVALNWYSPEWNRFIKALPYFASSSNLLRWFSAYIAVVILWAGLAFDRLPMPRSSAGTGRIVLAFAGLALMVATNLQMDRQYYYGQNYRIASIEAAYNIAKATRAAIPIEAVAPAPLSFNEGNDAMTQGGSQIDCYQPLFGYRLETFPAEQLHVGPILPGFGETVNLKNPACYVFPARNNCKPGDHFATRDTDKVLAFAHYRAFSFVQPIIQVVATWISTLTFIGVLGLLLVTSYQLFWTRNRRRT